MHTITLTMNSSLQWMVCWLSIGVIDHCNGGRFSREIFFVRSGVCVAWVGWSWSWRWSTGGESVCVAWFLLFYVGEMSVRVTLWISQLHNGDSGSQWYRTICRRPYAMIHKNYLRMIRCVCVCLFVRSRPEWFDELGPKHTPHKHIHHINSDSIWI